MSIACPGNHKDRSIGVKEQHSCILNKSLVLTCKHKQECKDALLSVFACEGEGRRRGHKKGVQGGGEDARTGMVVGMLNEEHMRGSASELGGCTNWRRGCGAMLSNCTIL